MKGLAKKRCSFHKQNATRPSFINVKVLGSEAPLSIVHCGDAIKCVHPFDRIFHLVESALYIKQ